MSASVDGGVDLVAARYAMLTRLGHASATSIVLWDYFLTFSDEVEFVWKRRWSKGSLLFFWNRYFGIIFSIFNAIGIMWPNPSHEFCKLWFRMQSPGSLFHIITTHVVLEVRIWALYRRNKYIGFFFVALTIAEIVSSLVLFEGVENIRTHNPGQGVFICADADPEPLGPLFWYFVQSTCLEGLLVAFVIYDTVKHWMTGIAGLVESILRDNVVYFGSVFTIYLLNALVWKANHLALNESLTGFFFGVPFVLSSRMLINIRVVYYGRSEDVSWGSMGPKDAPSEVEFVYSTASEARSDGMRRRRTRADAEIESYEEELGL